MVASINQTSAAQQLDPSKMTSQPRIERSSSAGAQAQQTQAKLESESATNKANDLHDTADAEHTTGAVFGVIAAGCSLATAIVPNPYTALAGAACGAIAYGCNAAGDASEKEAQGQDMKAGDYANTAAGAADSAGKVYNAGQDVANQSTTPAQGTVDASAQAAPAPSQPAYTGTSPQ